MASSGRVPLSEIWAMLGACAPMHTRKATKHYWRITIPDGQTYPNFPLGEHGARKDPEIQVGHIRKMARHLGILECAKQHIELLRAG
jgi:hypothetical protein